MNPNRTETLNQGFRRVKKALAFPLWCAAAFLSIPALAVLYWTDRVMNWAEDVLPVIQDE